MSCFLSFREIGNHAKIFLGRFDIRAVLLFVVC